MPAIQKGWPSENISEVGTRADSGPSSLENVTDSSTTRLPMQKQFDQVIRLLVIVTIIFSICQIPDMISQLLTRLYPEDSETLHIISYDLVIINSSINLFIYTATSQRFKKQFHSRFPVFSFIQKVISSNEGATVLDR